ncbi:hypothetical protein [Mycobacterium sp. NPDC050853]|uniref:hypothetical protein n=1 Tax=Mycobacterium sp. NPDC050853 TaxID=3155160 RepID=UPI0033FC5D94
MAVVGEYALHLQDAKGNFHSFLPGQKVPGWVADLVTNPLALVGDPEVAEAESDGGVPDGGPAGPAVSLQPAVPTEPVGPAVGPDAGHAGGQPSGSSPVEPPPHAGAGSGRDAWAQYASANGVSVQEESRRDQIIEACREAGVAL